MMNRVCVLCSAVVMGLGVAANVEADRMAPIEGAINPLGIYYNQFTGSFSGTEWFQTIPGAAPGQFILADIFGGGFGATITAVAKSRSTAASGLARTATLIIT
jgi:hypothetical protein